MLFLQLCLASAPPIPAPTAAKVKLQIDPERYRSSSQGPLMDWEVHPHTGAPAVIDLAELDRVVDRATRTDGWGPVIPQYAAARSWAYATWRGTIIEHLWRPAAFGMLVPALLMVIMHFADPTFKWFAVPDPEHPLIKPLVGIQKAHDYLLTLTTFVTTFFVGHSHSFWRHSYMLTRVVQGRLNDCNLMCSSHAARTPGGELTTAAKQFLKDTARQFRLMHILFWADVVYRRTIDKGASLRVVLSHDGLDRMRERGLLNRAEYDALVSANLPPSRWYMVVFVWLMSRTSAALKHGLLVGGPGLEQSLLTRLCELRGACMGIPDELAARMPLAYVHFTTFLVDSLLLLTPLALFPRLGAVSIVLGPLLVLFYRGLLELSKCFLDPFGNRRMSSTDLSADISVDTLLGESNAGSLVWPRAAVELPFELAEMLDPPPKPAADAAAMPERGQGHHHSEWWDSGQAIEVPAGQGPPVGVPPAVSAAGAAASAAGSAARKLGAWARGDV